MVPAKSGNREKIGKFVMGLEVGQGKMKYLKFHVAGFPVNREIYNTKTFLHSKIFKLLSAVGLYALPHSCSICNNNWMT